MHSAPAPATSSVVSFFLFVLFPEELPSFLLRSPDHDWFVAGKQSGDI